MRRLDALSQNGHIGCCPTLFQSLESICSAPHAIEHGKTPKFNKEIKRFPLIVRILFPRLLVIGIALSVTASIAAQSNTSETRPRYALTTEDIVESKANARARELEESAPVTSAKESSLERRFATQLLSAIESHLGATYRYNRTGPDEFDCSGLVWRAFNEIGINFQRGPARSYWATFAAPPKDEQFKFGNLVFFSGQTHVGIVADEKGFYHSSRRFGVIYSPFSDYWLSRIDGFRRVPLEGIQTLASEKARPVKPSSTMLVDESTPR